MGRSVRRFLCVPAIVMAGMVDWVMAQPDLVIEDVWVVNGQIYCQLANWGDAPAPPLHQTVVSVDSTEVGWQTLQHTLDAQESVTLAFQAAWNCSQAQDHIVVQADSDDVIVESDESNNQCIEDWRCDAIPPTMTYGPSVTNLTENEATIKWGTSETATGAVAYDHRAKMFGTVVTHQTATKNHVVTLTGLDSHTTYQVYVRSKDLSGNPVESEMFTFTTPQEGDQTPPVVDAFDMVDKPIPPLNFRTDVSDDTGVDHVVFYFDGTRFLTDYRAPFEAIFDPIREGLDEAMYYGTHIMKTAAVDRINRVTETTIDIVTPKPCEIDLLNLQWPVDGHTIYVDDDTVPPGTHSIPVIIYAQSHDCGMPSDFYGGAQPPDREVESIELRINGVSILTVYDETELLYDWNPVGKSVGDYRFKARVTHGEDCVPRSQTNTLHVVQKTATLDSTSRTVTRHGSYFTVTLTFHNPGTHALELVSISDSVHGFQVLPQDTTSLSVTGTYHHQFKKCSVYIELSEIISANETFSVSYDMVPVMYPFEFEHKVGANPIRARYRFQGDLHTKERTRTREGAAFESEVNDAFEASDYLIVTSPKALVSRYESGSAVQDLLGTMAQFAVVRGAVLGYFDNNRTIRTGLDANDGVAMGNVFGDEWDQEIFIANDEDDVVGVHRMANEAEIEVSGLSELDVLVVGNVDNMSNYQHHPEDEVLIADGHDSIGDIRYYMYRADRNEFDQYTIRPDWEPGDPLLTGDIRPATFHLEDELIIVKPNGHVRYLYDQMADERVFVSVFEPGDFVLTANIFGDATEEVVIGDKSENEWVFYDYEGTWLGAYPLPAGHDLNDFSRLDAGDLLGIAPDELVALKPSEDAFQIYQFSYADDDFYLESQCSLAVAATDVLFVADVIDSSHHEVLIGRREQHDGYPLGHFDVFSLPGTDKPLADRNTLDTLINPMGAWAENMSAGWLDSGYLLIIGETDIVPAFANSWELGGVTRYIESTDSFYGNTADGIKEPEIAVGRIIGDAPKFLKNQLELTMDVLGGDPNFDKSDALVVAGRNRGVSGEAAYINMTLERWSIRDILGDMGFFVAELEDPGEAEFFTDAMHKDVIHLAGHGNWEHCDIITADGVNASFDPGDTAPLIYANSCLTGKYTMGECLAECFLQNGALAYIGATETSYAPYNKYLAEGYHRRYDVGVTAGLSLKEAKRHCAGDTAYARYNASIQHLFGDPMLEPQIIDKTSSDSAWPPRLEGPRASVQVIIPDTEILSHETDEISIPGGDHLVVPGEPVVPTYSVFIDYPFGYQVQDVTLISKTDASYPTGLNIEIADPTEMGGRKRDTRAAGSMPDWWPESDFRWQVNLNADGSTTLVIEIYPFFHNAITHESRFYKEYNFDIVETTTTMAIHYLSPEKARVDTGGTIGADLHFENFGPSMDCLIEMTLESLDGTQIQGFPLALLRDVTDFVTYTARLDSTGLAPGPYALTAVITDTGGTELGRWTTHVAIGDPDGVIRDLTITPDCYSAGDSVQISCTFENTGDMALSGRLLVDLLDRENDEIIPFSEEFTDLATGTQVSLIENWVATTAYSRVHLSGVATFDGKSSPTKIYRFPADMAGLYADLPNWPNPSCVLDLIQSVFCDL